MRKRNISITKLVYFALRRIFRIRQEIPARVLERGELSFDVIEEHETSMNNFLDYNFFKNTTLASDNKEIIVNNANEILNNRIPILSENSFDLGDKIRWNYDYLTQSEYYSLSEAKSKGGDIKRIWELSRMHQLMPLCKAYVITNKKEYCDKIKQLIHEWIDGNPRFEGPNWINPMEISIRCANIINALFLCPSLCEDKKWLRDVNKLLWWSGVYVRYHLENTTLVNNNHYMSDLVGLLYISLYFKDIKDKNLNKEIIEWIDFSYKELHKEALTQILPDGGSFEKSTSYHTYVLELLFVSSILIKNNTLLDTNGLDRTVNRMRTFVLRFSHNNIIPFIGDSDNTRLFQFDDHYPYGNQKDYSVLFRHLNMYYNEEVEKCEKFVDSGHYFINKNNIDVVINCGRLYANAGHCHNDQLSYILWYNDNQVTEDSGTYCYTSDPNKRNLYRSTAQHSTIIVDGKEQNEFVKCFGIKEKTMSSCLKYEDCSFTGCHKGYFSELGVMVNRTINITNNQVNIKDSLNKFIPSVSKIILSPNVRQVAEDLFEIENKRFRINSDAEKLIVEDIEISLGYGQLTKTIAVEMFFSKELNYNFLFEGI